MPPDHLENLVPPGQSVLRQVHDAHPAPPKFPLDQVIGVSASPGGSVIAWRGVSALVPPRLCASRARILRHSTARLPSACPVPSWPGLPGNDPLPPARPGRVAARPRAQFGVAGPQPLEQSRTPGRVPLQDRLEEGIHPLAAFGSHCSDPPSWPRNQAVRTASRSQRSCPRLPGSPQPQGRKGRRRSRSVDELYQAQDGPAPDVRGLSCKSITSNPCLLKAAWTWSRGAQGLPGATAALARRCGPAGRDRPAPGARSRRPGADCGGWHGSVTSASTTPRSRQQQGLVETREPGVQRVVAALVRASVPATLRSNFADRWSGSIDPRHPVRPARTSLSMAVTSPRTSACIVVPRTGSLEKSALGFTGITLAYRSDREKIDVSDQPMQVGGMSRVLSWAAFEQHR